MVLVRAAGDVVDRDPLLVLDMSKREAGLVVRRVERLAAVPLDPVTAHVVRVRNVDLAVRVEAALPESVERQRRLVDAALRVPIHVRVGVVRPARRHVLVTAEGGAFVALDLVVPRGRSAEDRVRPQVEVVERAPLADEELRATDDVLGARLHPEPRLRAVRVQRLRAARPLRLGRAGRDRIATALHR